MLQGINDAKTFKILVVSFYALCSQQIMRILQKISSHLTGTFKNLVDLVLRIIDPIRRISSYRSFSLIKGQQAFEIKPVNITSQDH